MRRSEREEDRDEDGIETKRFDGRERDQLRLAMEVRDQDPLGLRDSWLQTRGAICSLLRKRSKTRKAGNAQSGDQIRDAERIP